MHVSHSPAGSRAGAGVLGVSCGAIDCHCTALLLIPQLPLTKISRNATGNLRACGGVRFRKFPWKFATAGGRVATRRGNSQTSTGMLVARRPIVALDQLLPSPTFRCLLVGRNTSRPGAESGFVRGICSTSVLKGWVLLVLPSER